MSSAALIRLAVYGACRGQPRGGDRGTETGLARRVARPGRLDRALLPPFHGA